MVIKTSQSNNTMHTAGIYSDMSIDGPVIGTLVVVVDRAKNLPNRRTMGKQDPYCACRLGKEAKKTNTDKRGGQVPRWDQELRFTVHDSPDYYQIKVSVFNDDKKTELIGENWVSLAEVIVPGGGQSDIWHNLNCKGKYAGEIRLELTYYDTRPKPEEPAPERMRGPSSRTDMDDEPSPGLTGPRGTPVKRRPLPSNPGSATGSPAEHARPLPPAAGPRGYGTPPRQLPQTRSGAGTPSSQRRNVQNNNQPQPSERWRAVPSEHMYPETPDDPFIQQPPYQEDPYQQHSNYEPSEAGHSQHSYSHQQYDAVPMGLPELPPMNSGRRPVSLRPSYSSSTQMEQDAYQPPELHHSQSAPVVPGQPYYTEETEEQRLQLHHSQSDSFVHQPQPLRLSRSGTMEPIYDNNQEPPQGYRQPTRQNSGDYSLSMAQSHPPYHGYDDVGPHDEYDPSRQWAMQPAVGDDPPPPPPPVHRDSAPSSAQRLVQSLPQDHQQDFTPAPLNIGGARDTHSRSLPYEEPQEYEHQRYEDSDYGGHSRRYTDPVGSSPHQEQAVYRPRALSGDAMRRLSPREDEIYPPGSSDYGPTTTSPNQQYYQEHRNSLPRQHDHSPAAHSPLAQESPRSFRESGSGPHSQPHTPSLVVRYNQKQISPTKRQIPTRPLTIQHSAGEAYQPPTAYQTPPRPHPLAQEVPVAGISPQQYGTPPQDQNQMVRSDPRRARDLQPDSVSSATKRKSVSSRPPSSSEPVTSTPYGPDSFDQFNPAAGRSRSTSSLLNHPATSMPGTPYDRSNAGSQRASPYDGGEASKIVDFHGNEIDPSDRLPETSWAPEPEPKGKDKMKEDKYKRDRDRLTGARGHGSPAGSVNSRAGGSPRRLSMMGGSNSASPLGGGSASNHSTPLDSPLAAGSRTVARNRLQKRNPGAVARPVSMVSLPSSQSKVFRDIPNPPASTSPGGFGSCSPHGYGGGSPGGYGAGSPRGYGSSRGSYSGASGAPPIPAKVPLGDGFANEDLQALSEEINRIDLGPAGGSGRARIGKGRMIGYR